MITDEESDGPKPMPRAMRCKFITCGAILPGTPNSSANSSAKRRSLCAKSSAKVGAKLPAKALLARLA